MEPHDFESSTAPPSSHFNIPPQRTTYRFSFHGSGLGFALLTLKNVFLTAITFGIYLPWARTARRKYLWANTEIAGERLRFHGTGMEVLRGYLLVLLGYAVFGGATAAARVLGNETAAAIVSGVISLGMLFVVPYAIYGSRRYLLSRTSYRGVRFGMPSDSGAFIGIFAKGAILTVLTLGIYGAVWGNQMQNHLMNRTYFGSERFRYTGTDREAFRIGLKGFLLTLLTLGIYGYWFQAELMRFQARNTHLQNATARSTLRGGQVLVATLAIIVGATLTAGLAFPWLVVWWMRTVLGELTLEGGIDFQVIERRASGGSAAVSDLASVLDVGAGL